MEGGAATRLRCLRVARDLDRARLSERRGGLLALAAVTTKDDDVAAAPAIDTGMARALEQHPTALPCCPSCCHNARFVTQPTSPAAQGISAPLRDAPGEIRTPDLRFRRPTLYPAELRAQRNQFSCVRTDGEGGIRTRDGAINPILA